MVVVSKIQAAAGMLSKDDHRIEESHSTVEKDSLIVMLLIIVGGREKVFNIHSWAILRRNNAWHDR